MQNVPMLQPPGSGVPALAAARAYRALVAASIVALASGCAATAELGRTERLPEGTLPPSKEVGPPVNIQPAPLAREAYRVAPHHPGIRGPVYGPVYGPGWYGPRCFDPVSCARPGFGLHYRAF